MVMDSTLLVCNYVIILRQNFVLSNSVISNTRLYRTLGYIKVDLRSQLCNRNTIVHRIYPTSDISKFFCRSLGVRYSEVLLYLIFSVEPIRLKLPGGRVKIKLS